MLRFQRIASAFCLLGLVACAGGNPAGVGTLPGLATGERAHGARTPAIVVLDLRLNVAGSQSIEFKLTPPGQDPAFYYFNTTSTSPHCNVVRGTTHCRLTFAIRPGAYSMTTTTYSGTVDENGVPTGKVLSADFFSSVNAGSHPSLIAMSDLTQDALHAIAVTPNDVSSIVPSGNAFQYPKCALGAQRVYVAALDASGAYIIGPNAPVVTLSVDNARVSVTHVKGNAFSLQQEVSREALRATITAEAVANAKSIRRTLPLVLQGGNVICGVLGPGRYGDGSKFDINDIVSGTTNVWYAGTEPLDPCVDIDVTGVETHAERICNYYYDPSNLIGMFVNPLAMAFGDDGLWFTDCNFARVGHLHQGSTSYFPVANLPFKTDPCGGPHSIIEGPDKAMWFVATGAIDRIAADGTTTEYPLLSNRSNPEALVAGPDGAIWFTDPSLNALGRLTTTGVMTETPLSGVTAGPYDMVLGPDGNLWFSDGSGISRMPAGGSISNVYGGYAGNLADGPDGAVWFVGANVIGRVTTSGVANEFSFPEVYSPLGYNGVVDPRLISAGPDDSIWVDSCSGGWGASIVEIR